jgi:hypothetical protein
VGNVGADDAVHLLHSIRTNRVFLNYNFQDFQNLHSLVTQSGGRHPGMLIMRRDDDSHRDMKPAQIVQAIANFVASGVPLANEFVILNQWR